MTVRMSTADIPIISLLCWELCLLFFCCWDKIPWPCNSQKIRFYFDLLFHEEGPQGSRIMAVCSWSKVERSHLQPQSTTNMKQRVNWKQGKAISSQSSPTVIPSAVLYLPITSQTLSPTGEQVFIYLCLWFKIGNISNSIHHENIQKSSYYLL